MEMFCEQVLMWQNIKLDNAVNILIDADICIPPSPINNVYYLGTFTNGL